MKYPLDSSKIFVQFGSVVVRPVMKYVNDKPTDEPVVDERGRNTYRLSKPLLFVDGDFETRVTIRVHEEPAKIELKKRYQLVNPELSVWDKGVSITADSIVLVGEH